MVKKANKLHTINSFKKYFTSTKVLIVLNIKSIKAEALRLLRRTFHKNNIQVKVAKNTLIKKAIEQTPLKSIMNDVSNQVAIVSHEKEELLIFKILNDYKKVHPACQIKCGFCNNKRIDESYINFLTKISNITSIRSRMLLIILNNAYKILYTIQHYLLRILNIINYIGRNNDRS